jgi:predicted DNA-binding protein
MYYTNEVQIMSATTLSFRAPQEFAEQTKRLASLFNLPSSEYLREAVREKNERVLKERMVFLSEALAAQNLAENQAMDAATGDGIE